MRLEIGFIDDPSFNAYATSIDDTDVIVIHAGIEPIMASLFRALLSRPEFLPDVGVPERCALRTMPGHPNDYVNATSWDFTPLECPERDALARMLASGSIIHTALHEFAHIQNGHLDYDAEVFGRQVYLEIDPMSHGGVISQTLEWDADLSATEMLLGLVMRPQIEMVDGLARWHITGDGMFGDRGRSIGLAAIVAIVFEMLLSARAELLAPELLSSEHPPALTRAIYNSAQIGEVLWFRAGYSREEVGEIIRPYLKALSDALTVAFPDVVRGPTSDREWAAFHRTMRLYDDTWAQIHPDLARLARGGRLAPPRPRKDPLR